MKLIALLLVALLAVTATAQADPCSALLGCLQCAGINGCGWCSQPITFNNGSSGPQCASPSSTTPFVCNGIYSTNQCLQGYICDQASGACRLAGPGQGVDFAACNTACTVGPAAEVYGCVPGSKSCVVVPPGTPGSGSQAECEVQCVQPAADVYKCNPATNKCQKVPVGTPGAASKLVCEALGCTIGTYACDLTSLTCQPSGGKMSNDSCVTNCRLPDDPCSQFTTCPTCLAGGAECGWCSQDVVYASGQVGGRCAGVGKTILPFQCKGTYSTTECTAPTSPPAPPAPATPSPNLPPNVNCPKGSMVLLQYNCADSSCNGCNTGSAAECLEPHCTLYCSGLCQPVPYWHTSFMWSCNGNAATGVYTNATLVHFLDNDQCTGPVNPPGTGGSGTYPLDTCGSPYGPNVPPQYNTFMCVPCGNSCTG